MVSRFFAILFLLMSSLFPLFGIKSSEPFISSDKDKKDWSIGGSDATNIKNQDIKIVKIKDSQGFVPPLIKGESIIFLDIKGYLRFANLRSLEETLVVPLYHPGFMSAGLAFSGNIVYCSIDNLLYAINSENGKLLWSKELRTRVAGEPTVFNGKVSVLTIDNYLYVFDSKNGNLLWSYQGVLIEQKSLNSASPSFSKDKNILLAPFSNGELLAFSESDGRKLWVQKFTGDFLKNPLNDINISPRIASGHAIVSSKSNKVSAFELLSGEKKWQKGNIDVNGLSEVAGNFIFVIHDENLVSSLDVRSGKVYWSTNLREYLKLSGFKVDKWSDPIFDTGKVWLINSGGFLLALDHLSGDVLLLKKIPDGVYHSPIIFDSCIYFFTSKGLIQIS